MAADWGKTWTEGDEYNTAEVFNMFLAAINERMQAIGLSPYPDVKPNDSAHEDPSRQGAGFGGLSTYVDSDPLCMTYAATPGRWSGGTPTQQSWYALQSIAIYLSKIYADPDQPKDKYSAVDKNAAIAAYYAYYKDPSAAPYDTDGGFGDFPPLAYRSPNLPGPDGWTRKRDLEITSLSATGDNGKKARFVWIPAGLKIDGPYQNRDNPFPDLPGSATGDRDKSRNIYTRTNGQWVLSTDPTDRPDTITLRQQWRPGDIFGAHLLNELRDVINLCHVVSFGAFYLPLNPTFTELRGSRSIGTSPPEPWGRAPYCVSKNGSAGAAENYLYAQPPNFCARSVTFYTSVFAPDDGFTYTSVVFDKTGWAKAHIRTLPNGKYGPDACIVNTVAATKDAYVFSEKIGDVSARAPAAGFQQWRGWSAERSGYVGIAVADFAVPDGFKYQG